MIGNTTIIKIEKINIYKKKVLRALCEVDMITNYSIENEIKLKRAAWDFAININQLDGEYKPSKFLLEIIDQEIKGKIKSDEIVKLLVKKYSEK